MNGIFLYLLLKEIKDKLIGLSIDEVRVMKRMVQLVCSNKALFISLYPDAPAIFLSKKKKENFERNATFSNIIKACWISNIEQVNFTPVVKFILGRDKSGIEIIISLYREAPNFSIKTKRWQKNLYSRYIVKQAKKSITELTEPQLKTFFMQDKMKHKARLITEFEGIDKYLADEITVSNIRRLKSIIRGNKAKPRLVSVVPLRISFFAAKYIKEYPSFNKLLEDGMKKFIERKEQDLVVAQKNEMLKGLMKRITRMQKKILNDTEIEDYRVAGELILANITKIPKDRDRVKLYNIYKKKMVDIKLDMRKTPQANAQSYFLRYKKLKRGQPKIKDKIKELEKEVEKIKAGKIEIPGARLVTHTVTEEKVPFYIFNLVSGSVIYLGKNARSNQTLTFKFAKPNDYFFHTRGFAGSHVILRAKVPKDQRPSSTDIKIAAAAAAYFSKARKQKNVAVSYTQRKYIKKDRKAKPGSVILMKEEVIFVDPGLPKQLSGKS